MNLVNLIFSDDFESGNLNNWLVDGRRLAGINTANTVTRYGSTMGHLYKTSFTEVTFGRTFAYDPMLHFNFDMEVTAYSDPAPPEYYGLSGVSFYFVDAGGGILGSVAYSYATSNYASSVNNPDPTKEIVSVTPGVLQHYSLNLEDMLALITIDESQIADIWMQFSAYSSTYPYPNVSAELWVDNVNTNNVNQTPVPEPATILLFGTGIAGLAGARLRRKSP